MKIYIVTPTYNALHWLRQCVRSVADQVAGGVQVHHHVQDGASADGTPAWLEAWREEHAGVPGYTFTYESARDKGMYDAINLAWEKLPGDAGLTAHLNSDEQYAPGALRAVAQDMQEHPRADLLLTSHMILDAEGGYICHRRPVPPCKLGSRLTCELMTCATFHRASSFRRHGVRFNTHYKSLADLVFYRDIIATSPKVRLCPTLVTSFFTVTGSNLAWTDISYREWLEYKQTQLPPAIRNCSRFATLRVNGLRRLIDFFCPPPRIFSLYLPGGTSRTTRPILHPTPLWRMRTKSAE